MMMSTSYFCESMHFIRHHLNLFSFSGFHNEVYNKLVILKARHSSLKDLFGQQCKIAWWEWTRDLVLACKEQVLRLRSPSLSKGFL
jgi:hypothetical protein